MNKLKSLALLSLFLILGTFSAPGQTIAGRVRVGNVDQAGACATNNALYYNVNDGKQFVCTAGTWVSSNGVPPQTFANFLFSGTPTMSCALGDVGFQQDAATPGQNLWLCTSSNTWTQLVGGGGTQGAPGVSNVISSLSNDTTTGTTVNQLAKLTAAGKLINLATTDTNVQAYVVTAGAGTTSTATVGVAGVVTCKTDSGGATIGHYIVASTITGGTCHDTGTTLPTGVWVYGTAQTTVSGGANTNVVLAQGFSGGAGGTGIQSVAPTSGGGMIVANGTGPNATIGVDSAVVPYLANSQAFAAGAKQTFTPNTTTAGARLVSGTQPNTPVGGDLNILTSDGSFNIYNSVVSAWQKLACTSVTMTANLPVIGNGTFCLTTGTITGAGTQFVMSNAPTISLPFISDFTNATHNHTNAAGGGQLGIGALSATGTPSATTYLRGDNTWATAAGGGSIATTSTILQGDGAGGAIATTETGTGNSVRATSPTFTTPILTTSATVNNNGVGQTPTAGLIVQNTTAAAVGVQQFSPKFSLIGQGWKTTATAASQTVQWDLYAQPVQSAAAPIAQLTLLPFVNGSQISSGGISFCGVANAAVPRILLDGNVGLTNGCSNATGQAGFGSGASNTINFITNSSDRGNFNNNGILFSTGSALMFLGTTSGGSTSGDVTLDRDGAGILGVQSGVAGTTAANYRDLKARHLLGAGTAPTLTVGTGTIAGTDDVGRVTLTAGSQTTITITFGTAYTTNIPVCVANDATTVLLVQAQPTLTTLVLNAAFGASDKIGWQCRGY
jgi:hypothetical protein